MKELLATKMTYVSNIHRPILGQYQENGKVNIITQSLRSRSRLLQTYWKRVTNDNAALLAMEAIESIDYYQNDVYYYVGQRG